MADIELPKRSEKTLIMDRDEDRWANTDYKLPKVGDTIESYKILELLGKGGFGAVFKVKNLNLGREEALKMILPSAQSQVSDIQKRFSREVDLVSRLEHPNIVRLYNFGKIHHNIMWMTMEFVEGARLDHRLEGKRKLPFAQVRRYMLQMLSGLMEAHKRLIVHRDLKPANIVISRKEGYDDQVVILDFGLAKGIGTQEDSAVQELTCVDAQRIYGTPEYMAPEQLNQGEIGPWTDVYAAGLLFYEMLTGDAAVKGDSIFDIAYKQSIVPLEVPEDYVGTAIETVLKKACNKDAKKRYQDAKEFFNAIQKITAQTDEPDVLEGDDELKSTDLSIPCLSPVVFNEECTQINLDIYSSELPSENEDPQPPRKQSSNTQQISKTEVVSQPVERTGQFRAYHSKPKERNPMVTVAFLCGIAVLLFAIIAIVLYVTGVLTAL